MMVMRRDYFAALGQYGLIVLSAMLVVVCWRLGIYAAW